MSYPNKYTGGRCGVRCRLVCGQCEIADQPSDTVQGFVGVGQQDVFSMQFLLVLPVVLRHGMRDFLRQHRDHIELSAFRLVDR
jgi:hypothetical protein